MTRRGFTLFLLSTTMLMILVSAVQEGLLDELLGTLGTVTGTVKILLTDVVDTVSPLFDSKKVIIIMKEGTQEVIAAAANNNKDVWTEKERVKNIENIVAALKLHAERTQSPVIQLLSSLGIQFKSCWLTNTIEVLNPTVALVQKLLIVLGVERVIFDVVFTLNPATPTADSTSNIAAAGWGATKIKAPTVWATNTTGTNIIVGTIDTGVRGTHETLVNNFVGAYGWYDPAGKTAAPYDSNGHGTHTMATIVGGLGVGIAPGAKWMSCKACDSSCTLSLLNSCGQYMLCPTDTNGNNCNAAKAPHIVSNSWGAGQGLTYFQPFLDAWNAARILPVFATGNSGANGCGTVVSPGDSAKAFAVGASDSNDVLGTFSSLGPAENGLMKPDFTAPGVSIRSAWIGNNSDYQTLSGTSMAAPHLAGTIALALSARQGFCFDAMKTVLAGSTDRALPTSAQTCGGTASSTFPNNQYGQGRINAQSAVNAALAY